MTIAARERIAPQDFERFVELPENTGRIFELIDGKIVEKMPTNPYDSAVAVQLAVPIGVFISVNDLGHVTGADGGYIIAAPHYFVPDVAFISKARQPALPRSGFNPIPPDLAIEVISPSDLYSEVAKKIAAYLDAGVHQVWAVDSDNRTLTVHTRDGAKTYPVDDTLDGGDLLPGFTLRVGDIFPD
jgi:Uma2 family endonuclease